MPLHKFAIVDPAAGISGDMLLGALLELGASPEWLHGLPSRLGVPDLAIEIDDVVRCGMRATKVTVRLAGATEEPADLPEGATVGGGAHGDAHGHPEPHHHHDDHGAPDEPTVAGTHHHGDPHVPHRHVGELLELIRRAPLSEWVRERAVAAFRLLAEAEGKIHGVAPDDVALHEVGAFDALVDIVGGIEGFEQLGITEIYSRPVSLGRGWVRAAHGALSVPTPATTLLMEGLTIAPEGPVSGEATTPTGAVLLRVLAEGPPPGRWRALKTGWGAGGRDPEAYPNTLKVVIAEPVEEAASVVVVSSDIDDLSPEYLEPLREALITAGALDVQTWTTQAKKGRVGFRVEAQAAPERAEAVIDAFFRHSTTAGVRKHTAERTTLDRRTIEVRSSDGDVIRVKALEAPSGTRIKPEFDDVIARARRTGRPAHDVAAEAAQEALRLVRSGAVGSRSVDQ
ncbi:MAG: LarC family nickel insertion protein [Gemmatimonadota bacterium]